MSFQNLPWLLWALPLLGLPVVIHLINRYRHRTVKWAAMMFLLDARRMTSGMARLRQIMILTVRTLAVAGLLFAVARPLASGWLGSAAGSAADTVIILLDRSASMEQTHPQTGKSKRAAALAKLSEFLDRSNSATQLVLIESGGNVAREIDSVAALSAVPETSATAGSADVPAMLQAALDYATDNQTGRTDIWLCSDLRASDWQVESGRWQALRSAFAEREAVRFYLLSYPEIAADNLAINVDRIDRRESADGAELMLDLRVTRAAQPDGEMPERNVSLGIIINGSRSVHEVTLAAGQSDFLLQGYSISIDAGSREGWGSVELPNDANSLDNVMYFVFSEAALRKTTLVSDDPTTTKPLSAAAGATANPGLEYQTEVVDSTAAGVAAIDWEGSAMIIWQATVPKADSVVGRQLQQFVAAGKTLLLFPPQSTRETVLSDPAVDLEWGAWREATEAGGATISTWRRDSDLTADTQDGYPLPFGEIRAYQWREFSLGHDATALAKLASPAATLISRSPVSGRADAGSVYVFATLPQASHSNLARDGVALFAMLHRALERGAQSLTGGNRRTCAPDALPGGTAWQPVANWAKGESTSNAEKGMLPGVFSDDAEPPRLIALNRALQEDSTAGVGEEELQTLFAGLDYESIALSVDDRRSLVSEIWRAFMIAMVLALIAEALLCLPPAKKSTPTTGQPRASRS